MQPGPAPLGGRSIHVFKNNNHIYAVYGNVMTAYERTHINMNNMCGETFAVAAVSSARLTLDADAAAGFE